MMNYDPDNYYGVYDVDDSYNEYGDYDAISCAMGDYNTWEENQLFYEDEY